MRGAVVLLLERKGEGMPPGRKARAKVSSQQLQLLLRFLWLLWRGLVSGEAES